MNNNVIHNREKAHHEGMGEFVWLSDDSIREVISRAPSITGKDILELCSGSGTFTCKMPHTFRSYICLDLSRSLLNTLKSKLPSTKIVQGDAEQPPFADASFDIVAVFAGLHHIPNLDNAVKNAYRLLRIDGQFVCFEPNSDCWYRRFMLPLKHFLGIKYTEDERFLRPRNIQQILDQHGFINVKCLFVTPNYRKEKLSILTLILAHIMKLAASVSSSSTWQSFFIMSGVKG